MGCFSKGILLAPWRFLHGNVLAPRCVGIEIFWHRDFTVLESSWMICPGALRDTVISSCLNVFIMLTQIGNCNAVLSKNEECGEEHHSLGIQNPAIDQKSLFQNLLRPNYELQ